MHRSTQTQFSASPRVSHLNKLDDISDNAIAKEVRVKRKEKSRQHIQKHHLSEAQTRIIGLKLVVFVEVKASHRDIPAALDSQGNWSKRKGYGITSTKR